MPSIPVEITWDSHYEGDGDTDELVYEFYLTVNGHRASPSITRRFPFLGTVYEHDEAAKCLHLILKETLTNSLRADTLT